MGIGEGWVEVGLDTDPLGRSGYIWAMFVGLLGGIGERLEDGKIKESTRGMWVAS